VGILDFPWYGQGGRGSRRKREGYSISQSCMVGGKRVVKGNEAFRGEGRNSKSSFVDKDKINGRREIRATRACNSMFRNHRKKGLFIEPLIE